MPIPVAVSVLVVLAPVVPGLEPNKNRNSSPARAVLLNLTVRSSSVPVFGVCASESVTVAVPVKSKSHFAVASTADSRSEECRFGIYCLLLVVDGL